ncbi:MAG TPA: hypothetical protein VF499_00295, partial [Afipia sp.]
LEASARDLDTDLARARAALEADERRLPAFEARLGQEFPDTAMLEEKQAELAALEAELATTKGEFDPGNDADVPVTASESGSQLAQAA